MVDTISYHASNHPGSWEFQNLQDRNLLIWNFVCRVATICLATSYWIVLYFLMTVIFHTERES